MRFSLVLACLALTACAADAGTAPDAPEPIGSQEQAFSDNLPAELQVSLLAPAGWTAQAEIWARVGETIWQSTKPALSMWHIVPEGAVCDTLGMGFVCAVGDHTVRIDCPAGVALDEPVAVRMSSAGQLRHQGWLDWDAWQLGEQFTAKPEMSPLAQPATLRVSLYGGRQDALVCKYAYGAAYKLVAR